MLPIGPPHLPVYEKWVNFIGEKFETRTLDQFIIALINHAPYTGTDQNLLAEVGLGQGLYSGPNFWQGPTVKSASARACVCQALLLL